MEDIKTMPEYINATKLHMRHITAHNKLVDKVVHAYGMNKKECSKIILEMTAPVLPSKKKRVRFEEISASDHVKLQ